MRNKETKVDPKLIILEGVDRTGKNSLQDAIDKMTKYKHFVMDRGPIGFKAYCEIYNKSPELMKKYSEMEKRLSKNPDVLVIYLHCSTEELVRRCKETNHEILDFDHHKSIYYSYFEESPIKRKVSVDSGQQTPEQIVERLVSMRLL